jgi:hypothetical protein
MLTNDRGYIQTSKVTDYIYILSGNKDVVYTKNSIYHIDRI